MVGPDLPSGLRRPDRSVSLRDPRKQPAQQMGYSADVRTVISKVPDTGEYKVRSYVDGLYQGEENDYFTDDREDAEVTAEAIEEELRAGAEAEALDSEIGDEGFIGELAPGMVDEARGLTADEAFQQYHATSGVGAAAGVHAMGGRLNPNQGELPGTGGPREELEETRGKVPRRTPAEEAAYEEALRKASGERSPGPVVVPPPVPPPVNQMENRNPELRSMDSQMMTDLMAERAAQPEQGYFGGMGNAVQELTETVRAMSGEEQGMMIAALIAAGLLTAGSGGMLAPAGAALMGGAGMAALNQ